MNLGKLKDWQILLLALLVTVVTTATTTYVLGQTTSPATRGGRIGKADAKTNVTVSLTLSSATQITALTVSGTQEFDKHDVVVNDCVGTDKLNELPMGTGRLDLTFKDKCYICATEVIGTVTKPDDIANLEFRWQRHLVARYWTIQKNDAGTQWIVRQNNSQRLGAPPPPFDDMEGGDPANDPTPSATKKIYSYDNSGTNMLNYETTAVGSFIYGEKLFLYTTEVKVGTDWVECGNLAIGQVIKAKHIANTGSVAEKYSGLDNTCAATKPSTFTVQVTEDKVRSTVGLDGIPITFDTNYNK